MQENIYNVTSTTTEISRVTLGASTIFPPSLPYAIQVRGCVGLRTILEVVVVKNKVAILQAMVNP